MGETYFDVGQLRRLVPDLPYRLFDVAARSGLFPAQTKPHSPGRQRVFSNRTAFAVYVWSELYTLVSDPGARSAAARLLVGSDVPAEIERGRRYLVLHDGQAALVESMVGCMTTMATIVDLARTWQEFKAAVEAVSAQLQEA